MNNKYTEVLQSSIQHLWLGIISAIWYKTFLFRCVNDFTRGSSTLILFGLVIGYSVAGIAVCRVVKHKEVSTLNVSSNLIIAYGIYTIISYYRICSVFFSVILLLSIGLIILRSIFIFAKRIDKKKVSRIILYKRWIRFADWSKAITCASLMLIMIYLSVNIFFGTSIIKSSVNPVNQYDVETQTIANNIETICLLKEDTWNRLTLEERLGVLQTIANIEQRYLGIPHELNVGAKTLKEGVLGCYDESEHLILISIDCLINESAYKAVAVIAHEARHAYQYNLVSVYESVDEKYRSLLVFSEIKAYETEFCNYIDGDRDVIGYLSQKCESDAYLYGLMAADDYFQRINEYLEST